jgi:hypothetical protein
MLKVLNQLHDGLVPYLVKAIQEQSALFEDQKVMINKMNNEIIELKMIVENLIKLNNNSGLNKYIYIWELLVKQSVQL